MPTDNSQKQSRKWHYSPLIGIKYGEVPVGLIGVTLVGIIYVAWRVSTR